jgi:hypothetical protein
MGLSCKFPLNPIDFSNKEAVLLEKTNWIHNDVYILSLRLAFGSAELLQRNLNGFHREHMDGNMRRLGGFTCF